MSTNIGFPADGEENRGWQLYITSLVMIISAGLFVVLRCAARLHYRQWGSDDYTIVVALLHSIAVSVAIQLAITNGYGQHITDLEPEQRLKALRFFWVAQTPYKIVVCLNKISVVLLYTRIFVLRGFRIVCWVVIAVLVAWALSTIFATIFQCVPIAASWNKNIEGECIEKAHFWVAYATGNVLTDVVVLVLPIPVVMRLRLALRARLMVCGVFLLGGFVTICSIMRTTVVSNSVENLDDITYNFIPRGIWTLVEANLGIICACLPILKQPLAALFPRLFSSTSNSGPSSRYPLGSEPNSASGHTYTSETHASAHRVLPTTTTISSNGPRGDGAFGRMPTHHRRASDELAIFGTDGSIVLGRRDSSDADQSSLEAGIKKSTRVSVSREEFSR